MEFRRSGSQAAKKGPADYFFGSVRIDPLHGSACAPSRVSSAQVTFEPCSRSNWHTHPLGQLLIVTAGCGLIQNQGGPIRVMRAGDVIWTPPGERHWHGAAPTTSVSHIAIQEELDGRNVDWLEPVTDDQYNAPRED